MLSIEESVWFISEVLKLTYNKESRQQDPIGFLNYLIQGFHQNIPFQSVTLLSKPLISRGKPTWEEIKTEVMSQRGGLCYTLNTFMKYLLESLGYCVYHSSCTIRNNNDHIATIAHMDNIRYYIDVGCGYPTFEAIPLDFEKESQIYYHSFLEYKLVKDATSTIIMRQQRRGDIRLSNDHDSWRTACVIDLTPREFDFFERPMSLVYSSPSHLVFHSSLRVVKFPNLKCIVLRDNLLLQENSEHILAIKEKLCHPSIILEKINDMFPLLYELALSAVNHIDLTLK